MSKRRRGMRVDQLELAADSRAMGMTWVEIAAVFRDRYGVNAFVAMRLAHGWSQRDAAEAWNRRWPDDPKTFKTFSYWENWPSPTGYAPSLAVLGRLAELYECAVMDLLVDAPDFRRRDRNFETRPDVSRAPAQRALAVALQGAVGRLADADVEEVAAAGLLWADQVSPPDSAYGLLMKLSAGLALAATAQAGLAPVVPDPPDDRELTGIWRSRHHGPGGPGEREHLVVLRASHGRLVGQSLPHPAGARLRLDLDTDGGVVSGTWVEQATGGRTAYGTVRLQLDPSGRQMRGRWLGFGQRFHVLGGDWELSWVQGSVNGRLLLAHRSAA